MARRVYWSFYYDDDKLRIQQVVNMGVVEGQHILTGQRWEEVRKRGDAGIMKWIADEMTGKTCIVILVGTNTSTRPWVNYEIIKAWNDKLGVVGIRIHGLRDLATQRTSAKGTSPFNGISVNSSPMANIVTLYDPPGADSKAVYASINNNIEKLVEAAIKIRSIGSPDGREACVVATRVCAGGAPYRDPDRPPASPCGRRRGGSACGQTARA